MAERQQTPSDLKCRPLDKIIEAMTAGLENSSENYVQFGVNPLQTVSPHWGDYLANRERDYLMNQPLHQIPNLPSMNPVSAPIYMQDIAAYNTNTGDPIYISPQSVNHLGINENNDLIEQCQVNNLPSFINHQGVIDREYGLFNDQRITVQHNNSNQSTNGRQIIDNLVGNWVPNQSGTYTPFGGSSDVPSIHPTNQNHEPEELLKNTPPVDTQQKKHRIVAEVKPMRPSYSSVLTKTAPPSPPPPIPPSASPFNIILPMRSSSDPLSKKTNGKNSKNKNKLSLLKRQNSSGSDDHGSPKMQIPKKILEKNYSNLSRRWVSLDNLGVQSECHEIDDFNKSDQFEKRKNIKVSKKNEKNDILNNSKVQNGNIKVTNNVLKRSFQVNNNTTNNNNHNNNNGNNSNNGNSNISNQTVTTDKTDKNQHVNNKNNKEDKRVFREKTSKRSHAEKTQQIKKIQKNRKRDCKESPMKDLYKNLNKYVNRWSKVGLKIFHWLLHLISDVLSMSINLVIQFVKYIWFYTLLYFKYSCNYVVSTFSKMHTLKAIGKRIDNWFDSSSKFAFWRRIKYTKPGKEEKTNWIQGGLEANIALPSTGEEAMKRLLACKGKDPYSILGVTPTCPDDDIKKYYKRQAFLVHPDKNNQPGAEEAFKILVHAFDIIGESERRQAFDQTRQVEAAWGELSDLISQLHRKMEQAANTIRCTNCGLRHKRIPTQRPCYAARFCAQCKIRHSAKEGDIWAESRIMGFLWHYYACMEGAIYDVTDWAACQAGNLKHLRANTHSVQYRIVLGQRPSTQMSSGSNKKRQQTDSSATDADLEDFLNNLYNQNKTNSTKDQASKTDNRRRKTKRK
ncbi:dnaJ homolog dnj-5 isoform X2 [Chelonus insularis]|uniref:dnaJ homolog dnj-5 isoform X2 n=1 Tax=Chelonus insularis TaxID=460826 RepID=UPI00158CBAD1|nr:dnaJ homolog dnj-5 isoform X2 [Chelonus insularis]